MVKKVRKVTIQRFSKEKWKSPKIKAMKHAKEFKLNSNIYTVWYNIISI